jgi:hypothetical protein
MLAWLVVAHVAAGPPVARATLPPASWASVPPGLPVSSFAGVRMGGGDVDLYCPHTDSASAVIVVAADRAQPRAQLADLARTYASLGYITVVPDRAALARVAAAAVAVPYQADEPGCTSTGVVGVIGLGDGGRAAMELHGVATVISLYAGLDRVPAHDAPALIVEIDGQAVAKSSSVWIYSEPGTLACDFKPVDDDCWSERREDWSPERERAELERATARRNGVIGDTVPWLHVLLDHDDSARHFLADHGLIAGPPMGLYAEHREGLPSATAFLFSLALAAGYSSSGGVVGGGRSELVFRHHRERITRGVGIGVYGEAASLQHGGSLGGAGITVVGYSGHGAALAPSFGVISGSHGDAMRAGLFFGFRGTSRFTTWDMPVGLRIDADYGLAAGHPTAVTVSCVGDVRAMMQALAEVAAFAMFSRSP